ncbi:MAG: cytochrome c maturation protein CcmE [Caldilineaceae bacterium]|nr:cytochrome c maturation protein CcmE [Caldilineaceae bacterium]
MTHSAEYIPSIPDSLAKSKAKNGNLKFILGGVVMLALVVVLIVYSTVSTGAYYLTVAETLDRAPTLAGQRVRVSGTVVDGSEDWKPQDMTLRFAVADESSHEQLTIVFHGPRPDNFQRAASAIIEGELMSDGSFQADTLLLKCPSRYEEEPEEVFVQSTR